MATATLALFMAAGSVFSCDMADVEQKYESCVRRIQSDVLASAAPPYPSNKFYSPSAATTATESESVTKDNGDDVNCRVISMLVSNCSVVYLECYEPEQMRRVNTEGNNFDIFKKGEEDVVDG